MTYCENCGTKIESDSNFCSNCGVKIENYNVHPKATKEKLSIKSKDDSSNTAALNKDSVGFSSELDVKTGGVNETASNTIKESTSKNEKENGNTIESNNNDGIEGLDEESQKIINKAINKTFVYFLLEGIGKFFLNIISVIFAIGFWLIAIALIILIIIYFPEIKYYLQNPDEINSLLEQIREWFKSL